MIAAVVTVPVWKLIFLTLACVAFGITLSNERRD